MKAFKRLRDLCHIIGTFASLEAGILDELEAQRIQMYALTQNQNMAKGSRQNMLNRICALERSAFGKTSDPAKPLELPLVDPKGLSL